MGSMLPNQDELLSAKLQDAVHLSERNSRTCFVGFLDERESTATSKIMSSLSFKNYMLWGGYDDSERVVFGAFPDYMIPSVDDFPIIPITVAFRSCDQLTHRDFLGALMSLGIQRSTIGDILVEDGRCVLFVKKEISNFILSQVSKIGRVGVKLKEGFEEPLPLQANFTIFQDVIASNRLDCVVAAAVGMSRGKASELITAGLIMVNHENIISVSASVKEGDKLSIRGKGRFLIDRIGPTTKKGRLCITGKKYI